MNKIILTGLLLAMSSLTGAAQTTSTITGMVNDPAGAVVNGAKVSIRNIETNQTRVTVTDGEGRYAFAELRVGQYEVRAEQTGFKPVARSLILTIGEKAALPLTLEISVEAGATVIEAAPLINTSSAELSYLVSERAIRELPLNGRNYTDLALLQPGVTAFPQRDGGSVVAHGLGMSINGQDIRSNVYLLDGTLLNDLTNGPAGSAAGTVLGTEMIREFRVESNSYSAEFGRNFGGQINAISKSGSNELHGSFYHFLRNDNLDARNFFDREPLGKPEFKRNQFGGALGGPLRRDRTFFFGGAEFLRERRGLTIQSIVPDNNARQGRLLTRNAQGQIVETPVTINPAVKPYLDAYPLPNGPALNGGVGNLAQYFFGFNQKLDQEYLQGRIDHVLNDRQQVFGRFTYDQAAQYLPTDFPQFPRTFLSRNQFGTGEHSWVISDRTINTIRLGFSRTRIGQDVEANVPASVAPFVP
ncbi:MAG: carboxypeptidase regulatory-like domain-containing protein, partial [Acidobacteriota bacterium]